MAWRRVTMKEASNLPFEYDEALIDHGIENAVPALEAAGVFGPEKQKKRLISGVGFSVQYENGKPIYSSVNCLEYAPEELQARKETPTNIRTKKHGNY